MSLYNYLILALVLFAIGAVIVLTRRSAVISLMGVELMLNAANLTLVTFGRQWSMLGTMNPGAGGAGENMVGQVAAFFVMVVAAAEVVVGLAIIVSIFRTRRTTSIDDVNLLKN